MSKKSQKSVANKSSKSVTTTKALTGARGALGGRGARTIAIENFIARSKRPVTVRTIEDALTSVKCIRNHVATLYSKRLLSRHDESGRPNDHGAFYAIRATRKQSSKAPPAEKTGAESK